MSGIITTFDGHPVLVMVDKNGKHWVLANRIFLLLGYKRPENSIRSFGFDVKQFPVVIGKGVVHMNFISTESLIDLSNRSDKYLAPRLVDWVIERGLQ